MMKKSIILFLIFIFAGELLAQAPGDEFSYRKWISTNDTLIVKRKNGDWWFGPRIGLNRNYYFGTLEYTTNNDPGNPFKRIVNFDVGDGGGAIYGGVIEYLPVGEKWGYGLNFSIIEIREVNASSDPLKDTFQTYYDFKSNLNYLVLSPFARLNFLFPGLFTFSGLDIAINTGQNTSFLKKFQNSGRIEQWQKENLTDLPISVGFHVGFGYDFFLADISEKARTRLTPFLSLNLNSSVIGDNNSTWSGLQLKMGFAVKLGFDNIQYDTLFYDKDFVPQPTYIAAVNKGRGVEFDGFRSYQEFIAANLEEVEISEVSAEVSGKDEPLLAKDNPKTEIIEETAKFNIGEPYLFTFASSSSTELSTNLKKDIEKMSKFLKSNPQVQVVIVGHSDNAGTLAENDRRARTRAQKTYQEFLNNGIKRGQLSPPTGRGSISPIADNNTEEGRRKNRRVEIIFIK